jgi:hypothetical protein
MWRINAKIDGDDVTVPAPLITELEQAMELAAPEIVRILIARAQCGDRNISSNASLRKQSALFNHLVGAGEQRWRNFEPERGHFSPIGCTEHLLRPF